jgi:hypothetical protein
MKQIEMIIKEAVSVLTNVDGLQPADNVRLNKVHDLLGSALQSLSGVVLISTEQAEMCRQAVSYIANYAPANTEDFFKLEEYLQSQLRPDQPKAGAKCEMCEIIDRIISNLAKPPHGDAHDDTFNNGWETLHMLIMNRIKRVRQGASEAKCGSETLSDVYMAINLLRRTHTDLRDFLGKNTEHVRNLQFAIEVLQSLIGETPACHGTGKKEGEK